MTRWAGLAVVAVLVGCSGDPGMAGKPQLQLQETGGTSAVLAVDSGSAAGGSGSAATGGTTAAAGGALPASGGALATGGAQSSGGAPADAGAAEAGGAAADAGADAGAEPQPPVELSHACHAMGLIDGTTGRTLQPAAGHQYPDPLPLCACATVSAWVCGAEGAYAGGWMLSEYRSDHPVAVHFWCESDFAGSASADSCANARQRLQAYCCEGAP